MIHSAEREPHRTAGHITAGDFVSASLPHHSKATVVGTDLLSSLRQALMLSAKLSRSGVESYDPREASPICRAAVEAGMILTLAGERKEVIAAGFLFNALQGLNGRALETRQQIIERKFVAKNRFDPEVLKLIESIALPPEADADVLRYDIEELQKLRSATQSEATLHCAVRTSLLAGGDRRLLENGVLFAIAYDQAGVAPMIVGQYGAVAEARSQAGDSEMSALEPSTYSAADIMYVRRALKLSSNLLAGETRKRGPGETIPLSAHAFEVGYLLLAAGASKESVVAGFYHDIHEGYLRSLSAQTKIPRLEEFIASTFGSRVTDLIRAVTEPPKDSRDPDNWVTRKEAVLRQIQESGSEEATLSCATKISTFADGNKCLKAALKAGVTDIETAVKGWSSGSYEQNLEYMTRYFVEYSKKEVPQVLLDQYKRELSRFHAFKRKFADAAAAASRPAHDARSLELAQ